ncbi:ParA family protein, partial [Pauljensenia sp. UMB3104]|uniref:ParA family protein n=1 Tax=Pauljensenia sp. UMB3104 TaxID=3046331 RepID=UPI00254F8720
MKIITFAAIKGGAGKTTALLMMAAELAEQGYKVLAADEDHQCNLTHYFNIYPTKGTIANVYMGGEVDIISVAPNIDLITGFMRLDE